MGEKTLISHSKTKFMQGILFSFSEMKILGSCKIIYGFMVVAVTAMLQVTQSLIEAGKKMFEVLIHIQIVQQHAMKDFSMLNEGTERKLNGSQDSIASNCKSLVEVYQGRCQ